MQISPILLALSWALPCIALADEPAVPAEAAAAAAPAVQPTATVAATPGKELAAAAPPANAAAEKTPAQLKKEAAEAKIRQYGVNGYKPETTKAGDTVYCKSQAPLGSHFETKQCRTFEQLRAEALQGKEYTEQIQHAVQPNRN
jgi:cell envelope opacity-associated protein A